MNINVTVCGLVALATSLTSGCQQLKSSNLAVGNSSTNTVKIFSSLPLTGSSAVQTQSIVNGIKQAIAQESTVCNHKLKIEYEVNDNASAASGALDDSAQVSAHANKAVADSSVVAFIGPYSSGAAKLVVPVLNQANLLIVSPASTYPGLTKQGLGESREPSIYYPTGKRNYARVVPTDDIQGKVAANWAKSLGVKKVYILDDQSLYGKGLANVFEATAKELGLQVLGREGIDSRASNYRALMTKIRATQPDLVYFGGPTQSNASQVVKDMRDVGMTKELVKFMGPDGIFDRAFVDGASTAAEGVYATFGGVSPRELTGVGKTWYESYKQKFNQEPEAYAAYGYEAAMVVLNGVNQVCKNDRVAIKNAVLGTKNFSGVLGKWSFDSNGDTTLTKMSGNFVKNGRWQFVSVLQANYK
ncbi:branched-chain amino acid ABC transporter substrate-binding protein [Iningainema tapete]|uniref:Branched-chain amino acid ABC transporter substrate-binding protein n=1 Tax=Iningainema tapete BLCC-T55 TaxID=2748662 RepID=A0A8J6XFD5_9CYAN|nr:branched-chain amino acid ABC transporter substrate-binding protein [Iningainema tapete]MBD2775610.1 branched-chain amino acid ABC transporter substrate-binding protein [Iningainema tapete BLCC-T55]